MAQLILTEEEKAALTWAELPDAAVGAATKRIMVGFQHAIKELDKLEIAAVVQHLILHCDRVNAETSTFDLTGVSQDGEDRGDWRVTVQRINPPQAK